MSDLLMGILIGLFMYPLLIAVSGLAFIWFIVWLDKRREKKEASRE